MILPTFGLLRCLVYATRDEGEGAGDDDGNGQIVRSRRDDDVNQDVAVTDIGMAVMSSKPFPTIGPGSPLYSLFLLSLLPVFVRASG
ncbi:hypothetical protein CPLU01_08548 [Colletotrichum plurivorum]|uniref:Uncharacterized protein n=1 Tax=Colletotrichum plurivorum TaxID=2175906 RepID=A0A8H6NCL5_9PEZI|nr:hypothetical protein CPLU01_08548 [Colletotrichum plurivorum]